MGSFTTIAFWGLLIIYGLLGYLITPKADNVDSFFWGKTNDGKDTSSLLLTSSVFISWIFAKSVTNAANLGAEYGLVGGVSYAIYWLTIPIGGFTIYRLRKKYNAKGLIPFLSDNYGKWAAVAFTAAILIRLYNEIWSNTSVIGGYYGEAGSFEFIIAALLFTFVVLFYCSRGGLRSSLLNDLIQTVVFIISMAIVLFIALPKLEIDQIISSGEWQLDSGLDLVWVSMIQIFSYAFHDPVLTDLGFITEEKKMLKSFTIAGILGFITILFFSFVGILAIDQGIEITNNVPASVGRSIGIATYFLLTLVMVASAGSTLDSTFSSFSKLIAVDIPRVAGKTITAKNVKIGIIAMIVFAVIGNLPMLLGSNILKATTISGTMVIGLAPIFLLHGLVPPTKIGFHLSFWSGIALGTIYSFDLLPNFFNVGTGDNALLLGVNLYGTILCAVLYVISGIIFGKKGVHTDEIHSRT
ncbi:hypothetical protein [Facklamia lactis]|uniref:hypothetical protein n=1 Tax=Facklamia lactis TaxID=2749967 RepID=UPI0018CE0DFF|nr:hypothetical protein [Facklamia lactis]MBG9980551.1 sodium:solute symporter [Facklamia lactis]